ncbi:MAG: hypothetical protein FWG87_11460 [Defluviitaleaceae bacterium]|nr:hypothetical protein [Defluviitaleaceae bacterium]
MSDTTTINSSNDENIEYIKMGNTTYKVKSFYGGEISFIELLKNALRREADALLRRTDSQ